jgi:hypothetical protein
MAAGLFPRERFTIRKHRERRARRTTSPRALGPDKVREVQEMAALAALELLITQRRIGPATLKTTRLRARGYRAINARMPQF